MGRGGGFNIRGRGSTLVILKPALLPGYVLAGVEESDLVVRLHQPPLQKVAGIGFRVEV